MLNAISGLGGDMRVLMCIIAFYPLLAVAKPSYICSPTAITGFNYKDSTSSWESTVFNSSHNWLLRPANEDERLRSKDHPYVVVDVGSNGIRDACLNEPSLGQTVNFTGLFMEFSFQLGGSNKYAVKSFGSYFWDDALIQMLGGGSIDSIIVTLGCSDAPLVHA